MWSQRRRNYTFLLHLFIALPPPPPSLPIISSVAAPGRLNCGLNTCPARHSARGVQTEPIDVRQLLTGLILPSSGDCPRRYKRTHLYFGFGGGRGHLVLLLGLQDLLHEATCSSSSRGNEENIKNPFKKKKNQICKLKGGGNVQILRLLRLYFITNTIESLKNVHLIKVRKRKIIARGYLPWLSSASKSSAGLCSRRQKQKR